MHETIGALSDAFEQSWKTSSKEGGRPQIENYLVRAHSSECEKLLRTLIPLDLHYRALTGESPRLEDYFPRFAIVEPAWLIQEINDHQLESEDTTGETSTATGLMSR